MPTLKIVLVAVAAGVVSLALLIAGQEHDTASQIAASSSVTRNSNGNEPVTATAVTAGNANLTKVPEQIDNRHLYNSNGRTSLTVYKNENNELKQLYAYFSANDRHLHVVERDFPEGEWGAPVDVHAAYGGRSLEWDNHNSAAVGVCPQTGHIFVTGNYHVDAWSVARTKIPGDIQSGFVNVPESDIIGSFENELTYPDFTTVGTGTDEKLVLALRTHKGGWGRARYWQAFFVYDHRADNWKVEVLTTGVNERFYTTDVIRDEATGDIHLAGTWRDESIDATRYTNRELIHLYSPDAIHWKQYGEDGFIDTPIYWNRAGLNDDGPDWSPAGHEVPQIIWDNFKGNDPEPNNNASLALDHQGYPHITVESRPTKSGKTYHVKWDGTEWSWMLMPEKTKEAPFRYGNRMGLIYLSGDEVRFRSLTPGDAEFTQYRVLAKGYSNTQLNIVPDENALKYGWLSFLVTDPTNTAKNARQTALAADANIVSIPLTELSTVETFTR